MDILNLEFCSSTSDRNLKSILKFRYLTNIYIHFYDINTIRCHKNFCENEIN